MILANQLTELLYCCSPHKHCQLWRVLGFLYTLYECRECKVWKTAHPTSATQQLYMSVGLALNNKHTLDTQSGLIYTHYVIGTGRATVLGRPQLHTTGRWLCTVIEPSPQGSDWKLTRALASYIHVSILNRASLNGHNFSFVGPITLILWFSESWERGLSDDLLKSKVYFRPVFEKYHGLYKSILGLFLTKYHGLYIYAHGIFWKWEIMASSNFEIWAYHLNGRLLSFQKIIKLLNLDHQKSRTLVTEPTLVLSGDIHIH